MFYHLFWCSEYFSRSASSAEDYPLKELSNEMLDALQLLCGHMLLEHQAAEGEVDQQKPSNGMQRL
jgi:hypothetical protein